MAGPFYEVSGGIINLQYIVRLDYTAPDGTVTGIGAVTVYLANQKDPLRLTGDDAWGLVSRVRRLFQ